MVQSNRLLSIVSVTMVTTLGWVTVPYSVSVYAQNKSVAENANSEAIVQATTDESAEPGLARTLKEPSIAVEDLALLTKPLTLAQLRHEAAGWFLLLQAKVQKVSEEEVVIRREKRAIDARKAALDKIEEAEADLEQVEAASAGAEPGEPTYQAFLQTVADAQTTLREAEVSVETALRAEEKVIADPSFQAALEQAQQEQSIIRIQEVLKSAQAFAAKLPVEESSTAPAAASSERSGNSSTSAASAQSDTSAPPALSTPPSIAKQVEQLSDAVSSFEVLEKRLKQISPDSPDHAKLRQKLERAQTSSRSLALGLIEQVPELADDVVIAEINLSQEEGAMSLAETAKRMLQETNATLEQVDVQLSNGSLDATTTQTAQQQLEDSRQALQKTVQQEADLKNQIVVDATRLRSEQVAMVDRLEAVLDELDAKGGDSSSYRQYIQAVSGIEINVTDTASIGIRLRSWLQSDEGGVRWRRNMLKFVSITLAFTVLSYLLSLLLKFALKRFTKSSSVLQNLAVVAMQRGGVIMGILIALTALEVSLTPLLAVLGGGSFVLAFALQSNLSNIASGLMMMWHKPFDIDDHVDVAGVHGFIKEITLTNTVIRSSAYDTYVLPNEKVWNNVIMNSTKEGKIRREVPIQVDFDVDIQRVESLLLEIAAAHPNVLEMPQPSIQVRFAESYVLIRLRSWLMPHDYDRVPTDLHCIITERFQQEGIAIAIPAQSVHYSPNVTAQA